MNVYYLKVLQDKSHASTLQILSCLKSLFYYLSCFTSQFFTLEASSAILKNRKLKCNLQSIYIFEVLFYSYNIINILY